jgi:hypothetical protein
MSEINWKERAILEAQRNAANGQAATAYKTAFFYMIAKLEAHHKSRPGITEIIRTAKRLVKEYGGLTSRAPDAATPTHACDFSNSLHCPACGKSQF